MRRLILTSRLSNSGGNIAARPNRVRGFKTLLRRLGVGTFGILVGSGFVVGFGLWAWESGALARQATAITDSLTQGSAGAGLAIDNVLVRGRHLTDPADLRAALGVQRGTPILSVQPQNARARIEALPWVTEAAVERDLPDLIRISLLERRPLALWQHRGRIQVIDQRGTPVIGADASRFRDLPLVVGKGAPAQTRAFLEVLRSEPSLAKRVQAAVRVSNRRWNVRLGNGVDVQLPDQDAGAAWSRLARLEERDGLLQRDIRTVDLRLPDQLVVRLAPGAEPYDAAIGPSEAT